MRPSSVTNVLALIVLSASWPCDGALAQGEAAEISAPAAIEAADDPCAAGKAQSPVEVVPEDTTESKLLAPAFFYEPTAVVLWNTGKNLRVDFTPGTPVLPAKGNFIVLDGVRFDLVELHFHRRAEHAFYQMTPAPVMEVHLVHADERGDLAVVGIPIALDRDTSPVLAPLMNAIPRFAGERTLLREAYKNAGFVPTRGTRAYRYPGSLTTPPYRECVRWTVVWKPLGISQAHFNAYKERFPAENYRDTQDLNRRVLQWMPTQ